MTDVDAEPDGGGPRTLGFDVLGRREGTRPCRLPSPTTSPTSPSVSPRDPCPPARPPLRPSLSPPTPPPVPSPLPSALVSSVQDLQRLRSYPLQSFSDVSFHPVGPPRLRWSYHRPRPRCKTHSLCHPYSSAPSPGSIPRRALPPHTFTGSHPIPGVWVKICGW